MALRTHVVLPEDLVEDVDRLAGKRKRSAFIEDAVREKVRREKLGRALEETAGILNPADYPEWETPEKTSEWVRKIRRESDRHMVEKLRRVGVEIPTVEDNEATVNTSSDEQE